MSDQYEGSQEESISSESTPFGSPPLNAFGPQPSPFGDFQQEMGSGGSSIPCTFPSVMTTGVDYGEVAVSATMQVFSDPVVLQDMIAQSKFESD